MKKVLSVLVTAMLVISAVLCALVTFQVTRGEEASLFGYRCFYLVSGSMEPTIPTGAAVILHKEESGLYDEGDIITFESHDTSIYGFPNTHRIVSVIHENGSVRYITKGDANNVADELPVYPEQIYGKVVFSTGSMTWIGSLLGLLTTPLGFVTVIVLPMSLVITMKIREFSREIKAEMAREIEEKLKEEAEQTKE